MAGKSPDNGTEDVQKHLPGGALLAHLTPPAGYKLDRALCASYSAQPAVLAAMLVAFKGVANDKGRSSRILLAKAMKELKGRVQFLVQEGRIGAPSSTNSLPALLDRFIVPMRYQEGEGGESWHPKICIVRYCSESELGKTAGPSQWRVWLGSRNFTRDDSWDLALYLTGVFEGQGTAISGVAAAAALLADRAGSQNQWKGLIKELESVKWATPPGLVVREVKLLLPGDQKRTFPELGHGVKKILAVSPFLDKWGVNQLGISYKNAGIRLISTRLAFEKSAASTRQLLSKFDSLYELAPASEDGLDADDEDIEADAAPEPRGLHAKFIWVEQEFEDVLYLGSPNLTERGWTRNAEVHAVVSVEKAVKTAEAQQLRDGITAFRQRCSQLQLTSLLPSKAEDPITKELEKTRQELAFSMGLAQQLHSDGNVEVIAITPLKLKPGMLLKVGRIGAEGKLWENGKKSLILVNASVESNSDLICLSLTYQEQSIRWLQTAPFSPQLDEAVRDLPLLEGYLGLSGLMEWLAEELSAFGVSSAHTGDWGDSPASHRHESDLAISVETVLAAWQRKGRTLGDAPKILEMAISAASKRVADDKEVIQLRSFERSWKAIQKALGGKKA